MATCQNVIGSKFIWNSPGPANEKRLDFNVHIVDLKRVLKTSKKLINNGDQNRLFHDGPSGQLWTLGFGPFDRKGDSRRMIWWYEEDRGFTAVSELLLYKADLQVYLGRCSLKRNSKQTKIELQFAWCRLQFPMHLIYVKPDFDSFGNSST